MIAREFSQKFVRALHPRVQDQGQERPGGARGHPPDRRDPPPAGRRQASRPRPGPPLRADLEAHGGEPDGLRRAGADHRRHRGQGPRRQALHPARHRLGRCMFEGFLKVYEEGRDDRVRVVEKGKDDHAEDDDGRRLPPLAEGDRVTDRKIEAEQHFTQPPPRFTEATLVKRMEELGIGRPSTYASTLAVLQERDYVRIDKKRLIPEDKGRLVTAFLEGLLQALRRVRFHRRPRGEARPHLRRQARVEGRAARLLARLHGRRRRDQGPARRRGAGRAQRAARPAHLPAQGRRRRPAPVPQLRRGPPQPQGQRQVRRLHRLLATIPNAAITRQFSDSQRRPAPRPPRPTASCSARSRDRHGRDAAHRPLRTLRAARRGRGRREAQALVDPQGRRRQRRRPRARR